ncbi:MAG: LacI family DNA-binding transcriptional regulator [Victivallales bacterium]
MTQAEIAKEFGISQTTVSYILKGKGNFSAELRQKIMERAKSSGYTRKKQAKKAGITIIINKLLYRTSLCDRFMIGIQEEAQKHGMGISHYIHGTPGFSFESLNPDSAGFILASLSADEADLKRFLEKRRPCVFLNRASLDGQSDSVMVDNTGGIRKAVRHLWRLGHRRIGFFGIRSFTSNRAERYAGYYQALAELDAPPPPPEWLFIPSRNEVSMKDVELLVSQALDSWRTLKVRPTAIVCSADLEALVVLKMAAAKGIRVPEDLSVVGFDDNEECLHSSPPLDSISQPVEQMGRMSVEMLMGRLERPTLPPRQWRAETDLVVRRSSVKPGEKPRVRIGRRCNSVKLRQASPNETKRRVA